MKNYLVAALSLIAYTVQAAPIDVTATVAGIAEQLTPIGLVGAAILSVFLAIKAFTWIRRAFGT